MLSLATNRFSADALEQIRMAAPKHATLLNSQPAKQRGNRGFVSVSFFFMVLSPFHQSLHETTGEIPRKFVSKRGTRSTNWEVYSAQLQQCAEPFITGLELLTRQPTQS